MRIADKENLMQGRDGSSKSLRRPRQAIFMVVTLLGSPLMPMAVRAEDYGDYGGYGREPMPPMRPQNGGGGGMLSLIGSALGGFLGSKLLLGSWKKKKLIKHQNKVKQQQKQLEAQQSAELIKRTQPAVDEYMRMLEERHMQIQELEVALYKLPDVNHDNLITRMEFNTYMTRYKDTHPELNDRDLPRFEDMDHDKNGFINFNEWEEYQQLAMTGAI